MIGAKRRHEHERILQVLGDALDVGLESLDAELAESVARVGQEIHRVAEVVDQDGLADVEFEVAARSGRSSTATSLPKTWTATMIMASHWVGFTLPGMIELPGSFSGRISSPSPERGPDPSHRMSSAIFARLAASVRIAPWAKTSASCAARAAN